jgi:hypothetical protein
MGLPMRNLLLAGASKKQIPPPPLRSAWNDKSTKD